MRAGLWLLLVSVLAILETGTGWFHDSSGHLMVDPVLVVTLLAGAQQGVGCGVACGLLGGLLVGAPGGVAVAAAGLYALGGGLATGCVSRGTGLGVLHMGVLGVVVTLMGTSLYGTGVTLPLVLGNTSLVAGIPLALSLERRRVLAR